MTEALLELSQRLRMPAAGLEALRGLAPAFDLVPFAEASRRGCLVAREADGSVLVVLGNPYDLDTQDPEQSGILNELRELDTPEALVQSEEIRDTINRAINALPEELRTAILLREIEGLSYEEIAQTMECPVGTVRSRIFRAREAIDKALAPLL